MTGSAIYDCPDEIDAIAKHLFWHMEGFDPSEPMLTWDEASEQERNFCRSCVRQVLLELTGHQSLLRKLLVTA